MIYIPYGNWQDDTPSRAIFEADCLYSWETASAERCVLWEYLDEIFPRSPFWLGVPPSALVFGENRLGNSYHGVCYHIILLWYDIYHVISYYIILYHILSYYIILYHIISHYIILYHIISYGIILYHIIRYFTPQPPRTTAITEEHYVIRIM